MPAIFIDHFLSFPFFSFRAIDGGGRLGVGRLISDRRRRRGRNLLGITGRKVESPASTDALTQKQPSRSNANDFTIIVEWYARRQIYILFVIFFRWAILRA